jgi:hypothetical protein
VKTAEVVSLLKKHCKQNNRLLVSVLDYVVLQLPEIPGVRDPDYATRGIPSGTGPVTVP